MQAVDDRANQYQATDEDLASMLGEDVTPMRTAQREAPQDPRMSRYEAQLARLEAEETDKLGALIAFLQGAGASGGTNLGATLMGGGSGIQARDARIRDEMTQTLKNIETLQLEREKMQAEMADKVRDMQAKLAEIQAKMGLQQQLADQDNAAKVAITDINNASKERVAMIAADQALSAQQIQQQHSQEMTALEAERQAYADLRKHGLDQAQAEEQRAHDAAMQAQQQLAQAVQQSQQPTGV
jgi:hypothetical protein